MEVSDMLETGSAPGPDWTGRSGEEKDLRAAWGQSPGCSARNQFAVKLRYKGFHCRLVSL
jgi:hypothetical protein